MFSSSYFLCAVLLRGLAGMALEKACEVGLVREIQLLGYGSHCLVRITSCSSISCFGERPSRQAVVAR